MPTIPDYSPPARPLDGGEVLAGWQDGQQRAMPASAFLNSALNASSLPYRTTTVQAALDQLFYVPPTIAGYAATPSVAEIGASVSSVALAWALNKAVTSQTINGTAISVNDRSASRTGPFTADQDFTLAVSDGNTTINAAASLRFRSKGYWGVVDGITAGTITDAQIRSLTQDYATTRARSVVYDASAGGYPVYAWPSALGDLTGVTVGGLAFTAYTVVTRSLVNGQGASVSYKIAVFNTRQTGAMIGVNWA